MAFKPVINFIRWDSTGSILYLKDTSPYGTPNPNIGQINELLVSLSLLNEQELFSQSYTSASDILSIAQGTVFEVNSYTLNQSIENLFLPFEDGVYNLDYYVFVGNAITVSELAGSMVINLPVGNTTDYTIYDSIKAAGKVYTINKDLTTLTSMVLKTELEDNISSMTAGYRTNSKLLNTKRIDYKLASVASKFAGCCEVSCSDLELLGLKEFAQIAFDEGDLATATKILSYA